jgi:hypothetical protein
MAYFVRFASAPRPSSAWMKHASAPAPCWRTSFSGVDVVTEKKAKAARPAASSTVEEYVRGAYWKRHLQHLKSAKDEQRRLLKESRPIGGLRLEAVTAEDIDAVLADRRARGIADGTLQRDWSAIRALFRAAWKEGRIAALAAVVEETGAYAWPPGARSG